MKEDLQFNCMVFFYSSCWTFCVLRALHIVIKCTDKEVHLIVGKDVAHAARAIQLKLTAAFSKAFCRSKWRSVLDLGSVCFCWRGEVSVNSIAAVAAVLWGFCQGKLCWEEIAQETR